MMRRMTQWLAGLTAVFVVGVLLAACGDDKKTTAADAGSYCGNVVAVDTDPGPNIDFEKLSPDQQKAEVKKYAKSTLGPEADKILKSEPKDMSKALKSDVDTLLGAVKSLQSSGDYQTAFVKNPKVRAADKRVHAYDLSHCGFQRQDVSGTEYLYQGMPAAHAGGVTSFEFANKGGEKHEINVLRINDDVKVPFADIAKLPQAEAQSKVEHLNSTDAEPGASDYVIADLKPGRYALACFLTVGGKEGAPTHASKGMFVEFKVG